MASLITEPLGLACLLPTELLANKPNKMLRIVSISAILCLALPLCASGPLTEATLAAAQRRVEPSRWQKIWHNSRRRRRKRRYLEDYVGDDAVAANDDAVADDDAAANDDYQATDDYYQKKVTSIADEKCSQFLVSFLEGTTDAHDTCEGIMNAYTAAGRNL